MSTPKLATVPATQTATQTAKPIQLPCPCCGESIANISVNLAYLGNDCGHFTCNECEAEFSKDDVKVFIRKWSAVLTWLNAVPVID